MVIDCAVFAVAELTFATSEQQFVWTGWIINLSTTLTSVISCILLTFSVHIELLKLLSINWSCPVCVVPPLATSFASADEVAGWSQRFLIFDKTTILQKEHFDDSVDLWIRKVIIDFALLFVASMLSEVFTREGVVVEMIYNFWVSDHLWIVVVRVAILAL